MTRKAEQLKNEVNTSCKRFFLVKTPGMTIYKIRCNFFFYSYFMTAAPSLLYTIAPKYK